MAPAWLLLLWLTVFFSSSSKMLVQPTRHGLEPPAVSRVTDLFPRLPFGKGFKEFFGGGNVQVVNNGSGVNLVLNKFSGSGFASRDKYHYGFFSAAIKLPPTYSAGVVVAFYMSNAESYPRYHDEIDFELLGHEKQKDWILQTNMYGNGSVGTGREEKFRLWFDPTEETHHYSILWNSNHIVFLVDNVPVREVKHSAAIASAYPSKPMSLYATIWDGSQWATHGGQKPVNYKFAPFVASFTDMEAAGCAWAIGPNATVTGCGSKSTTAQGQPQSQLPDPVAGPDFTALSDKQRAGLDWARDRFMVYSYCRDLGRYKVPPPECASSTKETAEASPGLTVSGVRGMFNFGRVFGMRN